METTMNQKRDSGGLNQGGPSDQGSVRPEPQDDAEQGSQSGRPQFEERHAQAELAAKRDRAEKDKPAERAPPLPQASTAEDERGISATEREAGTPDPRATTDWSHGEGEPPANRQQP
jgi:hypothetical protein